MKTTDHKPPEKINLLARLEELPHSVFKTLRPAILEKKVVSRVVYYNTLNGKQHNLFIYQQLSELLNCTINDVMDAEYEFSDPRKMEKQAA